MSDASSPPVSPSANHPLILVLNSGSSSLKFSAFEASSTGELKLTLKGMVDGLDSAPKFRAIDKSGKTYPPNAPAINGSTKPLEATKLTLDWLRHQLANFQIVAAGHRIVHGGPDFDRPMIIDRSVRAKLDQFIPLAPLHQPHNLAVVDVVTEWHPELPQVACFDTAFHRSHSALADVYALPWKLLESGIRRYGFHGLSYEFISSTIPTVSPELAKGRVIVAHLGNGASLCAMKDGRSVDCSMGFSTLDGVPMGTRPGAVDPGVLLYLLRQKDWTVDRLEELLYHKSGLLGLSGVSNDMRELLESADPRAQFAIDFFVSRVVREIGAFAASMGGLDGLVFTAGIGENSPAVRAKILDACAWLGVILDHDANSTGGPCISKATGRISAWVIGTNEELAIAQHALALVSPNTGRRTPVGNSVDRPDHACR